MAYCTINDLYNYVDQSQITAMSDDLGTGNVNMSIINAICQTASDKVDGLVSAIYQVPFAAPVPVKIKQASIIFAVELLWARRLSVAEKNPAKPEADMLRQELMDINRGLLSLDYASKRAFTPIVVGFNYNQGQH